MIVRFQTDTDFLCWYHYTPLGNNFTHNASTNSTPTLTDGETKADISSNRSNQFYLRPDVIPGHYHLNPFLKAHYAGYVGCPKIKLRPITIEKRGVTTTLFLTED